MPKKVACEWRTPSVCVGVPINIIIFCSIQCYLLADNTLKVNGALCNGALWINGWFTSVSHPNRMLSTPRSTIIRFDFLEWMNEWMNEPHRQKKSTYGHMRPSRIHISLRIRAVWSESSLGLFWLAKNQFLHADNEDSVQSERMCRLIWFSPLGACQKARFLTCVISKVAWLSPFIHTR